MKSKKLQKSLKIAPSNMTRVINCPFSHSYDEPSYYDPEIDYDLKIPLGFDDVAKGIVAHRYASAILANDDTEISEAMNTGLVDETMENNIEGYIDFIYQILPNADKQPNIKVEHYLNLDCLYDGCYGRADAVIDSKNKLIIVDLKYGKKIVEAEGNYQLMAYAIGAELESKRLHNRFELYTYHAHTGTIKCWKFDAGYLSEQMDFMRMRLHEALNFVRCAVQAGSWCETCKNHKDCASWYKRIVSAVNSEIEMDTDDWFSVGRWLVDEGKKKNIDEMRRKTADMINNADSKDLTVNITKSYKWTRKGRNHVIKFLKDRGFDKDDFTKTEFLSPAEIRDKFSQYPEIKDIIESECLEKQRKVIVSK